MPFFRTRIRSPFLFVKSTLHIFGSLTSNCYAIALRYADPLCELACPSR